MKTLLIASLLVSDPIPVTPWLAESLDVWEKVSIALCKKEKLSEEDCVESGRKELVSVREKVDEICKKHFPDRIMECTQAWVEYILDNQIIPDKIYKLSLINA